MMVTRDPPELAYYDAAYSETPKADGSMKKNTSLERLAMLLAIPKSRGLEAVLKVPSPPNCSGARCEVDEGSPGRGFAIVHFEPSRLLAPSHCGDPFVLSGARGRSEHRTFEAARQTV